MNIDCINGQSKLGKQQRRGSVFTANIQDGLVSFQ
jgi:hypothetical protein